MAELSLSELDGEVVPPVVVEGEKTAEQKAAETQVGIGTLPPADGVDISKVDPNKRPDDPGAAASKIGKEDGEEGDEEEEEQEDGSKGESDEEDEDFYAVVDKLRGEEISSQIEYPEGIEPTSPEGVLVREKFLEDLGAKKFEEYLKKSDPRSYEYLLHRQNGGDDTTFFANPSFVLPDEDDVKISVDLQRQVYTQSLISKGNSEKQVKALVDMAIKDGELEQEALKAYKAIRENDEARLAKIDKAVSEKKAQETEAIRMFDTTLSEIVNKGDGLKFIIPEADKPKFLGTIKDNIFYENGKFFLVKPLEQTNLQNILQSELFGYLNGDISKLVERQAKSVAAKRLSLKVKGDKDSPKSTRTDSRSLTLGEI